MVQLMGERMEADVEARLEAYESLIISLLTVLPEIEFGFFRQSFANQQPSDDRPWPVPPSPSLVHIRKLLDAAERGRVQLALNARREP